MAPTTALLALFWLYAQINVLTIPLPQTPGPACLVPAADVVPLLCYDEDDDDDDAASKIEDPTSAESQHL